jgi:tetratricopeptide (TPR) repeat protein
MLLIAPLYRNMSILFRIFFTLLLLPLIYLSSGALFSQFIVPTDSSSLWATPSLSAYSPDDSPSSPRWISMLDPLSSDHAKLLARAQISADDRIAGRWIVRARNLSVADPGNWVLWGMLETKRGRMDEGLAAFEKAISLNPSRPASYSDAGLCLFDALSSAPSERQPLLRNLAQVYLARGLDLDNFLWQDPHVCLALASIRAEKGDTLNAAFWAKRIVLQPPVDWPFAVRKLALCFSLGERVEAVYSWKKVFLPQELSSAQLDLISVEMARYSIPDFAYMRADLDVFQGKLDAAGKELSSLVVLCPHVADYQIALAKVYEKLGRRNDARLCYEKALELSPANQEAKNKIMEYYKGKM